MEVNRVIGDPIDVGPDGTAARCERDDSSRTEGSGSIPDRPGVQDLSHDPGKSGEGGGLGQEHDDRSRNAVPGYFGLGVAARVDNL